MNTQLFTLPRTVNRRSFLASTALSITGLALGERVLPAAEPALKCPIAVFSKVYQELKLDFAAAAEMTAEAGLDGIDCPVRPKGEIEPEHAADQLPLYAETLRPLNLKIWLLATGILSLATPFAESVLRTAKKARDKVLPPGLYQARLGRPGPADARGPGTPERSRGVEP